MLMLHGSDEGRVNDPAQALIVAASTVTQAHQIAAHAHHRAQLLYSESGNVQVTLGRRAYWLSENIAVYIPSGMTHDVTATDAIAYRSVFIDRSCHTDLGLSAGVFELNPLVRALISEAAGFSRHEKANSPEARLHAVLYDQLKRLAPARLVLPMPTDTRCLRICQQLLAHPADDRTLLAWAQHGGASVRTLSRIFASQTGLTFIEWRQRLRVSVAIRRLQQGDSVTTVALELGYRNISAFIAMFRQVSGILPSQLRHLADLPH